MSRIRYRISRISDFDVREKSIINDFVISHMERTLPDRDFNSQLMSHHLREDDYATTAWDRENGMLLGTIYYRVSTPSFTGKKVLFMICAVIDTDSESSGLASRLAYLTVKKAMGIIPVHSIIFACRTAIPRLVSGWINNSGAYPRIIEETPERIKELAHDLADVFYPHSEYDRDEMIFRNCYGFSKDWSYEIDYDSIKSKDEEINDYFKKNIFYEKNGKLHTSAHALFMLSEISLLSVIKYFFIRVKKRFIKR